ncbi:MAG TPA: hypothetical protein VII28_11545 [Puia sp.]
MNDVETIEEFYKRKFGWLPESIRNDIGHFNVFALEPILGDPPGPLPYRRKDYFKIMLVGGHSKVHYADKVIEVKKQALTFSSPQIPYVWEHLDNMRNGFFCVFNENFFHQYGNLAQYAVFQPGGTRIFELRDDQIDPVQKIFERMMAEINSEYAHKYDVLRTLVFELLHFAMKMV